MAARRGPTVRHRRLAAELRRLREGAALTLEQAAERLDWSIAKVSRIETARTGIANPDLNRLLELYDADEDKRAALLALGRRARTKGWWDAYADSLPSDYANYIKLEAEVASLRCYDVQTIHGLMQTKDYAREIIRSSQMALCPPTEIERRVEVRGKRQVLLTGEEHPLRLRTVIDEAALSRVIGSVEIMRAQLERLIELAELDNVTIQVMPNTAGVHPATAGKFAILEFPEPHDTDVVYVETMTSNLFIESDAEVYRYQLAFASLVGNALNQRESLAFITQMMQRLT